METKHKTIEKASKELVDYAVSHSVLEFDVRNAFSGGNLDRDEIVKIFKDHGVHFIASNGKMNKDTLHALKTTRNQLAHGTCSFCENGNNLTVSDQKELVKFIDTLLISLHKDVADYLESNQYLSDELQMIGWHGLC